ncbi:MAG: family 16 glycoside hydrolase [Chryseosolibacter sp.]
MKFFKNISLLALISTFLFSQVAQAQDNRTQQTRVADVLALLPAKDSKEADRLFDDLTGLNEEGLSLLTDRVLPNGKEDGVAARFAVSLLTHHAGSKQEKTRIEKAYLKALQKATDTEVKAYFIDNLKVIGTNASVQPLSEVISDEGLAHQAISALVTIGTPEARAALLGALEKNGAAHAQARLVQALGELKHQPAAQAITGLVSSNDTVVKKHALWSLALLGDASAYDVLLQNAKNVQFKNDPTEAAHALVEYMHQLSAKGNKDLVVKISQEILSATLTPEQQHFRLAALEAFTKASPAEATKVLLKEMNRFDAGYQKEVLKVASLNAAEPAAMKQWTKAYKKSENLQAEILSMLAAINRNDSFIESTLIPALESKNAAVRMAAAEEIAYSDNNKFQSALVDYLLKAGTDEEILAAKTAVLRMMDQKEVQSLAAKMGSAQPKNQAAIIQILAERRAAENFGIALTNTSSAQAEVRTAAYAALPNLATSKNTGDLLGLLGNSKNEEETKLIQAALIASIDQNSNSLINEAYGKNKAKVLPLLPYVKDQDALNKVTTAFANGNGEEKAAAFEALLNWQNHEAARTLLAIRRDPAQKKYHEKAFNAFVTQVGKSSWPDEQKLLMLDAAMNEASTTAEKSAVLRTAGNLRTFLALMFVSQYLDDKDLNRVASRSVMQIALPTSDARPGLTGAVVRNTLQKILDKLEGQDSQYEVIDIQTYLANMPYTKGFEPIFNGKDLSGWQGLVENPIVRAKMSQAELAKKQQEADAKVQESWSVKDGAIYFTGKGANLSTTRPYGDFEMLVDWKISRDGDSGIYLRGSPQVQIWDPTGKEAAAKVGSGGLFNNQKNPSKPLTVADNPVGDWNTFHIKMVGEKVTVHLNGVKVVDDVVMENYWDRGIPIFPEEAIELQAHGNELAFRNIYVKELGSKPYELTEEEKQTGFELIFNGKDLDNWVGNKTDYVVEDNAIAIYPTGKGHGNLNTEKEYSDFVFRFEFQLTPGANNGLGIHAPLTGNAAYEGKELQILDNTAPVYAKLEPYQYHGSVYGILPAKKGFLKPVGEWNEQEVVVKGDQIRITLNGTVILDGDLKKATKNGPLDKKEHPGLNRHSGHISFLGHGTIVRFRNIRVKDLTKDSKIGKR